MPIAREKYNGQSGSLSPGQNSHEIGYIVGPATGESLPTLPSAIVAALAVAPPTVTTPDGKTLTQNGIGYDPVHESGDGGVWVIVIRYGNQAESLKAEGTVSIEFDTAGASAKITQSKGTVQAKAANGETAPDFKGAIGISADGEVEGVDVPVPEFSFVVTKVFKIEELPALGDLWRNGSHTNNATFTVRDSTTGLTLTLNAGECLYLHARGGRPRSDGKIEIAFNFRGAPKVDVTIDGITVTKGGFEHVWVLREASTPGTGANKVLARAKVKAVYVERLFDPADFSKFKVSPT